MTKEDVYKERIQWYGATPLILLLFVNEANEDYEECQRILNVLLESRLPTTIQPDDFWLSDIKEEGGKWNHMVYVTDDITGQIQICDAVNKILELESE